MSHFSVLVAASDERELYERLIPYYEYGTSQKRDDELKRRGLLEFVSAEAEYRDKYENDRVEMIKMPDGRLLYTWDDEFRVPGTFGTGSDTHRIPEGLELVQVSHEDRYASFEKFISDWAGYEFDEEHDTYGYYHNPNAKWDWYTVGGRMSGILADGMDGYDVEADLRNWETCELCRGTGKRRDVLNMLAGGQPPIFAQGGVDPFTGEPREAWNAQKVKEYLHETGCNGCDGKGERLKFPSDWVNYNGDSPLVGMVNWEQLRQKRIDKAIERWNKYHQDYGFWYTLFYRWIGLAYHLMWPVAYRMKWWFVRDGFWKVARWLLHGLTDQKYTPDWEYDVKVGQSRGQYIARRGGAVTYAFVDLNGDWYQRGKMGWWGIDDESKGTKDYDKRFWQFIESLPPEQRIYVVDCHI